MAGQFIFSIQESRHTDIEIYMVKMLAKNRAISARQKGNSPLIFMALLKLIYKKSNCFNF